MKQAIQIGAGNIGRGFMGALLEQAGWHVTFADVVESIISEINTKKCYRPGAGPGMRGDRHSEH